MVKTDTTMTLEHFHDFYYLQAVEAAIVREIASDETLLFSRKVEKLQDDVEKLTSVLFHNMALRTFLYLYAACYGEARHAKDSVAERYFIKGIGVARTDAFSTITNFPPTEENLNALLRVFDQPWRSGYGGKAWADIVRALKEYGKSSVTAWLDHIVDLEHNNGTVFSKPEGRTTLKFQCKYPTRFSAFLDYKFHCDILRQHASFASKLNVSPDVYAILNRYSVIFKKPMPHVTPDLQKLTSYEVTWGNKSFALKAKHIDWSTTAPDGLPESEWIFGEVGGLPYVYNITLEKLTSQVDYVVRKVHDLLGKKMNAKLAKKIKKAASDYIEENKDSCIMKKAAVTYTAIPCAKINGRFFFFVPHQDGYGERAEGGFTHNLNMSYIDDFKNGYISRGVGGIRLYTEDVSYIVQSPVLEALID